MIETNDQKQNIEFPAISICERFPRVKLVLDKNFTIVARLPFPTITSLVKNGLAHEEDGLLKISILEFQDSVSRMNQAKERSGDAKLKNHFLPFNDDSVKCKTTVLNRNCYPKYYSIGSVAQCRTFFGQLDQLGRVDSKVVKYIKSSLDDNIESLAFFGINFTDLNLEKELFSDKEVFIMVHGSNESPSHKNAPFASRRFKLKANRSYDLSFWRKKYIRLPHPYKTDCRYYITEDNSSDIYGLSRQMCLTKCRNVNNINCQKLISLKPNALKSLSHF